MKPNLGYYIQAINDIVQDTEKVGEEMNTYYEELRQAIDDNKTADIAAERLSEIQEVFKAGTKQYEEMLKKILGLKAPVKVMGIHKKLERSYTEYVAGCQEMILSLDSEKGIDTKLFETSEKKQDEATDTISFCITKMSSILLKK